MKVIYFEQPNLPIQSDDPGQSYKCSWFNGIPVIVHRADKDKNRSSSEGSLVHDVVLANIQPGNVLQLNIFIGSDGAVQYLLWLYGVF